MRLALVTLLLASATLAATAPAATAGDVCSTHRCCSYVDPAGQPGSPAYTVTYPVSSANRAACYAFVYPEGVWRPWTEYANCVIYTPGPCQLPVSPW